MTERLLRRVFDLDLPHKVNMPHGRVTLSMGVALFKKEMPETAEAVLARADEALYEAKAAGRNTAVVATSNSERQSVGT